MAAAVAPISTRDLTLYSVEQELASMEDTEGLVPSSLEEQFLADFGAALTTAADKRDQVAHFLAHLESQQAFAAAEIARLQAMKRNYEVVQERLENYVKYVILSMGKDAKGKWKKLEGHTTVMSIQKSPDSIEITDERAVPLDYERATVTVPAGTWQEILNQFPELLMTTCKLEPSKSAIKAAIDAGESVPGAKLVTDKMSLRRR